MGESEHAAEAAEELFAGIKALDWETVFMDPGTGDWRERWMLDGLEGDVSNGPEGMTLTAGPHPSDNASHMVLWTQESFTGDVRIDYEYTRRDRAEQFVNIIYIQASGSGEGPYDRDISRWNALREVPAMSLYFNHMNLLHISYAAFGPAGEDDYIRARRYMPLAGKGLHGTDLEPDYLDLGLFRTGETFQITIIKKGTQLMMEIRNEERRQLCHWETSAFPAILEGRMGLRHMWTRSATYRNFRVSTLRPAGD